MTNCRSKYMRNRLAGSVALLLALSACGQSEPAADPDPADDRTGDSGTTAEPALLPPQPVRAGGAQGAAGGPGRLGGDAAAASGPVGRAEVGAAATAENAASGGAVAQSGPVDELTMLAPWSSLHFVAGDGVSLPTADTGYLYAGTVAPDLDQLASLARSLDVSGDIQVVPSEEGGGWRVGPTDGSAPSLYVAPSGQLDWWYNQAWDDDRAIGPGCVVESPSVDVAPRVDNATADGETVEARPVEPLPADAGGEVIGGDAVVPECEVPEPPQNVPTADEAVGRASQFIEAAMLDVSGLDVETYADEWMASVSYRPANAAQPPRYLDFGFGENGELQWASGTLGTPEAAGPYPLVDLTVAVERLNNYFGFDGMDLGDPAVPAPAVEVAPVDPAESGPATDEAAPVDVPEPVDHVVTMVSAVPALWSSWDPDGSVWYVPAFEFTGDDGTTWTVPAVTDEFLIVDEPVAEPIVGEEPPADAPGDVPGDVPVDIDGEIPLDEAMSLIGLSEDEARQVAQDAGWDVRIVAVDGEYFAVTEDYVPTRVNLTIVDNLVTEVSVG